EGHEFLEFYPSSSKPEETDAIEFHVPNVGKNYLDPSAIFLYVKAKIVRGGGGSMTRQRDRRDTFKTEETSGTGTHQQQQQQSTGSGTQQQSTSSGTPSNTESQNNPGNGNSATDIVVPVDNFINSMFQHVDIYFNQKL